MQETLKNADSPFMLGDPRLAVSAMGVCLNVKALCPSRQCRGNQVSDCAGTEVTKNKPLEVRNRAETPLGGLCPLSWKAHFGVRLSWLNNQMDWSAAALPNRRGTSTAPSELTPNWVYCPRQFDFGQYAEKWLTT